MGSKNMQTARVLTQRVGGDGLDKGIEVLRVHELLWLAGYKDFGGYENKTKWTDKSAAVLTRYLTERAGRRAWTVTDYLDPIESDKTYKLLWLMWDAGVLSLMPGTYSGKSAVLWLYEHLRSQCVPYGWKQGSTTYNGGTRMVWGLEGFPGYCVYLKPEVTPAKQHFKPDGGIGKTLNCTAFANLMLAAWFAGTCNGGMYSASQFAGAFNPLGRRYNYAPLPGNVPKEKNGVYTSYKALEKDLKPDTLYHFAAYNFQAGITHDMVLLNGTVYESNKTKAAGESSVRSSELEKRMKKMVGDGKGAQVLGPVKAVMV